MLSVIEQASPVTPTVASVDALEAELTTLAGHLNSANYRFLQLLGELDACDVHRGWGIVSCAHWLSWRCGVSLVAARDKLRVARALRTLPKISEAMRTGTLSYSKVRALTRIATPALEDSLLYVALNGTVSQLEKTVRLYRNADRQAELDTAKAQHQTRELTYYFDEDGSFVLRARLDPEQGALVQKAIEAAMLALAEAESSTTDDSRESSAAATPGDAPAARRADALGLMAETLLAHGATALAAGDRHLVTVHVDAAALHHAGADGQCAIDHGPTLAAETVRRLCCDSSLVTIIEDQHGKPLDVGRKTRAIPPALRRAINARDAGCRYPGCTNHRFVDAHHIEHWADGGETKMDNLILLCRRHHRAVHEYGVRIEQRGAAGEVRFVRADGRVVMDAPQMDGVNASREGWLSLQNEHAQLGLRIDADTTGQAWRGERADYAYMVGLLMTRASAAVGGTTAHPLDS